MKAMHNGHEISDRCTCLDDPEIEWALPDADTEVCA